MSGRNPARPLAVGSGWSPYSAYQYRDDSLSDLKRTIHDESFYDRGLEFYKSTSNSPSFLREPDVWGLLEIEKQKNFSLDRRVAQLEQELEEFLGRNNGLKRELQEARETVRLEFSGIIENLKREAAENCKEIQEKTECVRKLQAETEEKTRAQQQKENQIAELKAAENSKDENIRKLEHELGKAKKQQGHLLAQQLGAKVRELEEKNENLQLELSSRPTHKQFKSLQRATTPVKIHSRTPSRKHSVRECSVLNEMCALLHVKTSAELVPALNAQKADAKFLKKLASLVRDCSPPDTFHTAPTNQQMWKWIRRILEEHLKVKKGQEEPRLLLSKLQGSLGVSDLPSLSSEVAKLIGQNHVLSALSEKTREFFKVPDDEELERLLDSQNK